jgi:hypothetical protein
MTSMRPRPPPSPPRDTTTTTTTKPMPPPPLPPPPWGTTPPRDSKVDASTRRRALDQIRGNRSAFQVDKQSTTHDTMTTQTSGIHESTQAVDDSMTTQFRFHSYFKRMIRVKVVQSQTRQLPRRFRRRHCLRQTKTASVSWFESGPHMSLCLSFLLERDSAIGVVLGSVNMHLYGDRDSIKGSPYPFNVISHTVLPALTDGDSVGLSSSRSVKAMRYTGMVV